MSLIFLLMTAATWLIPTNAAAAVPAHVVTEQLADGQLVMHYPERFEPAAEDVEQVATASLAKLRYRLGIEQMPTINVWLIEDLDHYFTWNEIPSRAPSWAVGLSLSDQHTVLVRHGLGPNRRLVDIEQTLEHELAHVAIDVARGGEPVPRWFNEGFARWHAGEWGVEDAELVARSAAISQLIPLNKLERTFPDHQQSTSLAYAQSHHFVRRMTRRYGDDVFAKILDHIRAGETFSVAFTLATGDDFENFEQQWRTELMSGSSPLSNLADGTIFFFLAGLLFLVAWWVRRKRKKEKLATLDDDIEGWDYDPARYPLPDYDNERAALR